MTKLTLDGEDWRPVGGLFDAFHLLSTNGLMSALLWRRFHCICCRGIWQYIADNRSKAAVETAEGFVNGVSTLEDLQRAFEAAKHAADEAWDKVQSLRLPGDSSSAEWPVSEAVDQAWIEYSAASAAKSCADTAEEAVLFTTIPDSACDLPAWRDARSDVVARNDELVADELRDATLKRWDEIRCGEEKRLIGILRHLVDGEL